jgi:hypothetical protein
MFQQMWMGGGCVLRFHCLHCLHAFSLMACPPALCMPSHNQAFFEFQTQVRHSPVECAWLCYSMMSTELLHQHTCSGLYSAVSRVCSTHTCHWSLAQLL